MDISALESLLNKNSVSKSDFKTGFKAVQQNGSYSDGSVFGADYSEEDTDKLFANFDKNGDGIIDKSDKLNNSSISEDVMKENDLNLLVNELNEMFSLTDDLGTTASSDAGGSGGVSASSGAGGQIGDNGSSESEGEYSSMSVDELQAELTSAKAELATKQEALNSVIDGSDSTLSTMQEGITAKEQEYQELLSTIAPKLAEEYKTAKEDLDSHNQAIADTTVKINETQANVDSLSATVKSLESQIGNYEASISNLKAQEGSENAPADLSSKISALEAEKDKVVGEKKAKEEELRAAEKELSDYQNTLSELESQTSEKEQNLQTLQDKIDSLNNKDLENLKTEIDTLKADFETQKTSMQNDAQEAVDSAKETVDKIQEELNAKKNQAIKNKGFAYDAKGLYDSLGLEKEGLSFEKFSFMFEGYNNLEDKGNGRISIVDEKSHNCFVIDMNTKQLIGKYRVSTGEGGSKNSDIDLGNTDKKHATPGGWIKIDGTHNGKKHKGAVKLKGLESCNSNTYSRNVIGHHIDYSIGYSTWGCLGFRESVSTIRNTILKDGGLVFVIKEGMIEDNSKYRKQSKYYST